MGHEDCHVWQCCQDHRSLETATTESQSPNEDEAFWVPRRQRSRSLGSYLAALPIHAKSGRERDPKAQPNYGPLGMAARGVEWGKRGDKPGVKWGDMGCEWGGMG